MSIFRYETDADGVAVITWDLPGRSMNVLGKAERLAEVGGRGVVAEIDPDIGVAGVPARTELRGELRHHARSTTVAAAMPLAKRSVASPVPSPVRSNSSSSVPRINALISPAVALGSPAAVRHYYRSATFRLARPGALARVVCS